MFMTYRDTETNVFSNALILLQRNSIVQNFNWAVFFLYLNIKRNQNNQQRLFATEQWALKNSSEVKDTQHTAAVQLACDTLALINRPIKFLIVRHCNTN